MKTKLNLILTFITLIVSMVAFSQQTVTGLVTDSDGVPIPGATVNVKESSTATTTDFDGRFTINASMNDVLVVSYVGYVTQEVSVTGASVEVALTSSTALDEVVITGFGEVTRQAFTGSAKVVAGETLQKKSFTNITQALSVNLLVLQFLIQVDSQVPLQLSELEVLDLLMVHDLLGNCR